MTGKTLSDRADKQRMRGTVTDLCPTCGQRVGLVGESMKRHNSPYTGARCEGTGRCSLTARTVPGLGDDPLSARRRGADARSRILPIAQALVVAVRDEDRAAIGARLEGLGRQDFAALAVVLAAMVPDDVPAAELLSWITFEDDGRPLPRARIARSERSAA